MLKTIKTNIVPLRNEFYQIHENKELDLKAICCFVATGFFLDQDTYWKHKKVLAPATINELDEKGKLLDSKSYFKWYHAPRDISFDAVLDEFTELFETIVSEQTKGKKVILPLSGGLDSRTQAVALRDHPDLTSFSYEFLNGYPETKIAEKIAKACNFSFQKFQIPHSYLWSVIEDLAEINQCYSEFTHPRQMAVIQELKGLGDLFSLGHLGDLFFESMGLPELTRGEQIEYVKNLFLKKGGKELADKLWESWDVEGCFSDYFHTRIEEITDSIEIENTNAKLRALKSKYSVTRWSSNNLSVFESVAGIALPYYDKRMCDFICTVPESYLTGRLLQVAYIKRKAPDLAKITWQAQKPFNLNNHHYNKRPLNLPYRVIDKLRREFNGIIGKPHISRNWELQFLGKENDAQLIKWLFESDLRSMVPNEITDSTYSAFKAKDSLKYAHPVSMLLTLALFNRRFNQ